jgi:putative aldouronate transport system substrate-binding protein
MKKRIFLVFLILMILEAPIFGGGEKEKAAETGPAKISYMIRDLGRYQTNPKKHIPLSHLAEKFNVEWDLIVVPSSDFMNKLSVTLVSGDVPDIIIYSGRDWPTVIGGYGLDGYFLDFKPHIDAGKMPNLVKNFYNKIPNSIKNSMTDDGKLYYIGRLKTTTDDNFSQAFCHRKDIFAKHGMTAGNTFDSFYHNLKQLKQLYPDKFPFSVPHGVGWMLNQFAPLFETGIGKGYTEDFLGVYYDHWSDPSKFTRAGTSEKYKKMLQFLNKLYTEGLLHPEFNADRGRATYHKLIVNNQIYMGINSSYVTVDTVTVAGQKENNNPEFEWTWSEFPSYNGPGRTHSYLDVDSEGKVVSAKSKNIDKIVQILDYMCTEDYFVYEFWGAEGETYTRDADGKPQRMEHMVPTQAQWDRGLVADNIAIIGYFPGQQEAGARPRARAQLKYYDNREGNGSALPDDPYLSFTEDEVEKLRESDAVKIYGLEMAMKFITGEESFVNWDKYVARLQELGVNKIVAIYSQAFERYKKRTP